MDYLAPAGFLGLINFCISLIVDSRSVKSTPCSNILISVSSYCSCRTQQSIEAFSYAPRANSCDFRAACRRVHTLSRALPRLCNRRREVCASYTYFEFWQTTCTEAVLTSTALFRRRAATLYQGGETHFSFHQLKPFHYQDHLHP